MKNLTFALACASTFALFADIDVPKADFEKYAVGDKVSGMAEPDKQHPYWLYEGASGSDDGSTVKAYGGENLSAPAGSGQNLKYLELSTEGGTLWRSLAAGDTGAEGIDNKLGAAQVVPDGGLYIDTMVQFTPTEDGGAPEVAPGDKLAIWLNVDSSSGEAPVTNLMVKAGHVYRDGSEAVDPMTFVLEGTSGVVPGTWYRLTVKAIPDVTKSIADGHRNTGVTGYQILLDGQALSTTATVFESSYINWAYEDWLEDADRNLLQSGTVFAGLDGFVTASTLQAVGFKGSGALDDLSISETAPSPAPEEPIPVTPQITLSATEATFSDSLKLPTVTVAGNYVLGTDYTVSWSGALPTENPSADVVLTVTVEMCGKYSGNNTATFTVKPAGTPPVVNDWPSDPTTVKDKTAGEAYGFTGDLAGVPADKLAVWAMGNGSVAFSNAGTIKIEAYLLNVANTDAAIAAGKANFKIPAITVDANGTVTVTSPDPDGSKYNGVITIKGSVTVNGTYDLVKGADDKFPEGARFFKAFLSVK